MKKTLRTIYEALPFKLPIYKMMRKIIRLPKKWQAYFYFTGDFKTKAEDKEFYLRNYGYQYHVENELFWGGLENGWEKESMMLWAKLVKFHNHILDIGANTGAFSILAKTLNPQARITAFEPIPKVHEKLLYNIELNKQDIQTTTLALSNYTGEAKIFPTSVEHVYSVTVNQNRSSTNVPVHELTIHTIRLDEFIEKYKLEVDLIKIDVESHEPEVLEGMGTYLKKFRPTFLIEIQTDEIATKIEKLIEGCGYLFYNIDENSGIYKVDKLTKSLYFNFLLCSEEVAKKAGLMP